MKRRVDSGIEILTVRGRSSDRVADLAPHDCRTIASDSDNPITVSPAMPHWAGMLRTRTHRRVPHHPQRTERNPVSLIRSSSKRAHAPRSATGCTVSWRETWIAKTAGSLPYGYILHTGHIREIHETHKYRRGGHIGFLFPMQQKGSVSTRGSHEALSRDCL